MTTPARGNNALPDVTLIHQNSASHCSSLAATFLPVSRQRLIYGSVIGVAFSNKRYNDHARRCLSPTVSWPFLCDMTICEPDKTVVMDRCCSSVFTYHREPATIVTSSAVFANSAIDAHTTAWRRTQTNLTFPQWPASVIAAL